MWDKFENNSNNSGSDNENSMVMNEFSTDSNVDDLSLDYLPNELKYIQ